MRAFCLIALVLTGCAASRSGETAGGPRAENGDFVVSARFADSIPDLLVSQHALLEQARGYCEVGGKRFDTVADDTTAYDGVATYRLRFRCLNGDDPRVARPATNGPQDRAY